jgi:hypothetical protein
LQSLFQKATVIGTGLAPGFALSGRTPMPFSSAWVAKGSVMIPQ